MRQGKTLNMVYDEIVLTMKNTHGDLSIFDEAFLGKTLEKRWTSLGLNNAVEYLAILKKNGGEADALYRLLYVSFSQFFRDPITFAMLEQRILPDIIARKRDGGEIRVWSAGCAQGQEAYSLAILLAELTEVQEKNIRYRIFATDISPEVLAVGRSGIYVESAIQEVRKKHLDKYFFKQGNKYCIVPELGQYVSFHTYDLLDSSTTGLPESIYGDYDLVICCNVLLYYKADVQKFIMSKLQKSTAPDGYFVTGEAETALVAHATKLQLTPIPTAILKNSKRRGRL